MRYTFDNSKKNIPDGTYTFLYVTNLPKEMESAGTGVNKNFKDILETEFTGITEQIKGYRIKMEFFEHKDFFISNYCKIYRSKFRDWEKHLADYMGILTYKDMCFSFIVSIIDIEGNEYEIRKIERFNNAPITQMIYDTKSNKVTIEFNPDIQDMTDITDNGLDDEEAKKYIKDSF